MLTNQEAKPIAEANVTVLMTMSIRSGSDFWRSRWTKGLRFPPKLFDRAKADAISFSESTIDGPRFSHTHFSAPNER
jgi:hypothetical protein